MKLFIILVVTLAALFGVGLADKQTDYLAYKAADAAAIKKDGLCSKYAGGKCASIEDCEECIKCLEEVIGLYQTAVNMRRDFRNRYYPGEHDPDHINWEKKMTSGNGTRGKKRDACRSSKSGKERAARRQQEEEQRLAGTASPAVNNSAPAGNSRARSPTTRARGRSPTVARSPTTRARGRGTPAMRSPIRSQSKPRHTRMPTGPRKAFGRPRRFRRRP